MSDLDVIKKIEEIIGKELNPTDANDMFIYWRDDNCYALDDNQQVINLNLTGCNLNRIDFLTNLKNIAQLNLSHNQINDISALKQLENLIKLDLSFNQISKISALKELGELTVVNLNFNKINNINTLKGLKKLTQIVLWHNQIKILPKWSLDFNLNISLHPQFSSNENGICLLGNPLEEPPPEVIELGNEAIKSYFNSGKRKAINELKIILVGEGGAGKTSLSKVLRDELFDKNENQTHGINIFKQSIDGVSVNFWDFGGQEMMHSTHQFFLSKRSLYILVLDSREEDKAEYWLKYIESFGGDSPILVVLNKIDQHPSFDVNRKALRDKYKSIQDFYKLSCATKDGLSGFKEDLVKTFGKILLIRSKLPVSWFAVKKQLEDSSGQENFIDYQTYRKLCDQQQIKNNATQDVLAQYLNDLGVIVHFTDPQLMGTPVLNPRWITKAVYKIINFKPLAEAHGIFCLNDLPQALAKQLDDDFDYPKEKHDHIINLMKKFELCYEADNRHLLIPDLLEIQEPNFDFENNDVLRFRIRYDFLPRSIMPRFIVKRHQDIEDNLRWRTGVVLESKAFHARAIVKVDYDEKLINITVNGDGTQRRDYFAIIRNTLDEIHRSFEKIGVTEFVPLPNNPQYEVKYQALIGYEKAKKLEYFDGELGKSYSVSELLNGIEKPESRESANLRTINLYNGTYYENHEMSNERTINATNYVEGSNNGNIAGRDIIQTQTNDSSDMKSLLAELLKQIEEIKGKSTIDNESILVQMSRDAETLASEINNDIPRKQWCDLSLDGIRTAAQKIGDIALPIINVVDKFSQLPSFG